MSDINISDLSIEDRSISSNHEQALISKEIELIESATLRAIDTRKIVGGLSNNFDIETRGGKMYEC